MTLTPSTLADLAQSAALAVGPALLEAFKNPGKIEYKRNFHDPVTVHDRRAEKAIRDVIFAGAPDSLILGEEEGKAINALGEQVKPGPDDVVWLVDPIDGTANFTSGLIYWCVSIAATRANEVIAGVIYQPTREVLYRSDDTGAYRNGTPIRVRNEPPQRSLLAAGFPSERLHDQAGAAAGYRKLLEGSKSVRRLGSTALHFAGVAEGTFGGCMGMGTQPWDIGAGVGLVQAAGGIVIGVRDDHSRTTSGAYDCPNYVAAAHPDMAELCLAAIDCVAPQALHTDYLGTQS